MTTPEQPDTDFSDPEPSEPLAPPPPVPHAATRHMCVGCYVDHEFRERAMTEVYLDRSRQVAPAYGYDLVPVLVHARRAGWIDHASTCSSSSSRCLDPARSLRRRAHRQYGHHLVRAEAFLAAVQGLCRLHPPSRQPRRALAPTPPVPMADRRTDRTVDRGDRRRVLQRPVDSRLTRRAPGTRRHRGRTHDSQPDGYRRRRRGRPASLHRSLANDPTRPRTYSHRIEQVRTEQYRPITIFSGYRPYIGSGFRGPYMVVRPTTATHRRGQRSSVRAGAGRQPPTEPDPGAAGPAALSARSDSSNTSNSR